ncbi:hypothetical protein ACFQ2H_13900 [Streptomyces violaceoruber]
MPMPMPVPVPASVPNQESAVLSSLKAVNLLVMFLLELAVYTAVVLWGSPSAAHGRSRWPWGWARRS